MREVDYRLRLAATGFVLGILGVILSIGPVGMLIMFTALFPVTAAFGLLMVMVDVLACGGQRMGCEARETLFNPLVMITGYAGACAAYGFLVGMWANHVRDRRRERRLQRTYRG